MHRHPPPYPGTDAIVDGSEAIASVETRISEIACAYPITPSTTMAAVFQAAVADGRTNLWGTPLRFVELESEHSSASSAEGVALAGGRVTNFTAGQGLVLMKEVLFVIAGKRLPVVFHIGARALTSHSLNVHAGHDDVYGVADCGWGVLFARNAQEAADLALFRSLVGSLVFLGVLLAVVALVSPWAPGLFVGVFLVSIGASALAICLQMRLMETAGDAQMLGAALNHSALNLANALGAWLGGLVIAGGLGYRAPSVVGAGLAVAGLVPLAVSGALRRRHRAAPVVAGRTAVDVRERVPAT